MKINALLTTYPVAAFLLLTAAIALLGFAFIATVPGANTPESKAGLPFWALSVWSPTLSALLIWAAQKQVGTQLLSAVQLPPPWAHHFFQFFYGCDHELIFGFNLAGSVDTFVGQCYHRVCFNS